MDIGRTQFSFTVLTGIWPRSSDYGTAALVNTLFFLVGWEIIHKLCPWVSDSSPGEVPNIVRTTTSIPTLVLSS